MKSHWYKLFFYSHILIYTKKVLQLAPFCKWKFRKVGSGLLQCYRRLLEPIITTPTVPFCVLRSKKKMKSLMWYLSRRLRAKRGSGLPKEEQRIKVEKDQRRRKSKSYNSRRARRKYKERKRLKRGCRDYTGEEKWAEREYLLITWIISRLSMLNKPSERKSHFTYLRCIPYACAVMSPQFTEHFHIRLFRNQKKPGP